MSAVIPVSADWLTLREPADAAARSLPLARRAASLVPAPAIVHDLGSGTGSMMRWLAPLLPPPQTWVLHDWNPSLLARAAATPPPGVDAVRTRVGHLEHLDRADIAGAHLVVTSALLDVLSSDEVEAIVDACVAVGAPALFALSVDGVVTFDPVDPGDVVLAAAFNDHQRRLAGGRRLLGPEAATLAAELFRSAGWTVETDASPWRLGSDHGPLIAEWLDGWLAAAVEERPALTEWAREYAQVRSSQVAAGRLRVEVQHRDLLAWPS
ncbi:class I SAM-dependent methyltransferase [Microbacterium insulae]|uniref:Class I SAM-dependent methyltransferase n=1 Tax=Microbacterium insulae TaxID=483014 RepID=A0ABW3AFW0_9MICO